MRWKRRFRRRRIDPDKVWFTSDTHFRHQNILIHCYETRSQFTDIHDHDETIIKACNAVVKPDDYLIHLGDFSWCSPNVAIGLRQTLTGNVVLIAGNHDRKLLEYQPFIEEFTYVTQRLEVRVMDPDLDGGQLVVLDHYPMLSWNSSAYGSWMLHGHTHGTTNDQNADRFRIDLSLDNISLLKSVNTNATFGTPWSYWDIKRYIERYR